MCPTSGRWSLEMCFPACNRFGRLRRQGNSLNNRPSTFKHRDDYELYDLTDPEIDNLAGNPDYERELNRLIAALEDWYVQVGDRADVLNARWSLRCGGRIATETTADSKVEALEAGAKNKSLPYKGASIGYKKNDGSWQITQGQSTQKTDDYCKASDTATKVKR